MGVSRLTASGDWRFGKGRADYASRSEAIAQNVKTRIRSFTDDWFVNVNEGIPWVELLGTKGTKGRILREIEARVLATEGVRSIERLRIQEVDANRGATIELSVVDIFDERTDEVISVI